MSHVVEPVRLALFGDSLAAGVGATSRPDTLGPLLSADLASTGVEVEHRVYASSGARSVALAGQVATAGGWPRLAVVVVGANDLTHFVPVPEAVAHLAAALGALRRDGVEVVLVPAPDLGVVTLVPPDLRGYARDAGLALRTAQRRAAEAAGVHVVDTSAASELFAADPSMFSADRFHPSSAGYRVIAAAVAPVLRAAARALLQTP
ncbi:SGNH/GDSL hydrolase family protein [Kineococcus sp. GCM10028916]|uniref:SGNH/GDSL hydrolase family protein n=1 Tax=Kineococcus sp. GCM10028916 TaxID=3273394 RepID=UPI0036276693